MRKQAIVVGVAGHGLAPPAEAHDAYAARRGHGASSSGDVQEDRPTGAPNLLAKEGDGGGAAFQRAACSNAHGGYGGYGGVV